MSEQLRRERPILWKRWALVVGLSALMVIVVLGLPALAQPRASAPRWETRLQEQFSGAFPGAWIVTDTSSTDGGEYTWGATTFTATSPITAVWSVGGGADGISLTAGISTYVDNVDSWLIYGPLDLSQAFDAELVFDWWLDAAPMGTLGGKGFFNVLEASTVPSSGDWLGWCALTDPTRLEECQGTYVSGSTGRWLSGTLSLKPYTAAISPTRSVWIAFHFHSDGDGRVGRGAFLDNVVLRVNLGYQVLLPLIRREPTPTPSPTPTPTPVVEYYDDFTDAGSGWPNDKGQIWYEKNLWDVWWRRGYVTSRGEYRIAIDNGPAPVVWFWQPDALAPYVPPSDTYCVETEARFEKHGWWANGGLVFGANDKNTDLYMLCLGVGANELGWHVTRNPNYEFPRNGCAYEDGVIARGGKEGTSWDGWNRLQVSVNGDWIRVYVGGLDMGSYYMPGLASTTRVGLVGGDYEVSDVDIRFKYFRVIPNAACTP